MILSPRLVLQNLAVNFIDQEINSRVEIVLRGFAVNVFTADVERNFRSVLEWLERQDYLRIDHMIKVAHDARHLCVDIFPDGWGDVKMMTSNVQVHCVLSIKGIERLTNMHNCLMQNVIVD